MTKQFVVTLAVAIGAGLASAQAYAPPGAGTSGPGPLRGIEVTRVFPSSAADGRLESGDIILSINGMPTPTLQDLDDAIAQSGGRMALKVRDVRTGRTVEIRVWSRGRTPRLGIDGQEIQMRY